ncbi:hypothetical protein D3C79_1008110 [compost metagenome]
MLVGSNVIGLGGGKHQLVDGRREQPAEQRALAVVETLHQLGQRQAHVVECLWAAVERLQAVNQHNLPIETDEMFFIEVFDD